MILAGACTWKHRAAKYAVASQLKGSVKCHGSSREPKLWKKLYNWLRPAGSRQSKKKIQFKGASVEEGGYVGGSGGVDRADLLVSNKVGFMGLQLFALQTCDTFIGSHYVPQWTQQQAHLLCNPDPFTLTDSQFSFFYSKEPPVAPL